MVFWGRCSVPVIVERTPEPSAFLPLQCQTNSQGFGIFLSPASAELPRSRYLFLTSVGRTPKESASFSHQCRPNSQGVGIFPSEGVGILPSPVSDELPRSRHFLSPVSAELPRSRHFLSPLSAELPRSRHLSLTSVGRTSKPSAHFCVWFVVRLML